jgi:hypothetical protein
MAVLFSLAAVVIGLGLLLRSRAVAAVMHEYSRGRPALRRPAWNRTSLVVAGLLFVAAGIAGLVANLARDERSPGRWRGRPRGTEALAMPPNAARVGAHSQVGGSVRQLRSLTALEEQADGSTPGLARRSAVTNASPSRKLGRHGGCAGGKSMVSRSVATRAGTRG